MLSVHCEVIVSILGERSDVSGPRLSSAVVVSVIQFRDASDFSQVCKLVLIVVTAFETRPIRLRESHG